MELRWIIAVIGVEPQIAESGGLHGFVRMHRAQSEPRYADRHRHCDDE